MSIDAHVHVWTDDRKRYPRATGQAESRPDRFTPEDYFSHARPSGVTRAVLIQMSFYRFDNSYMLDTIRGYPGKFSGVGIVDSASPAPHKAMEDLAKRGVRGFRSLRAIRRVRGLIHRVWKPCGGPGQSANWPCALSSIQTLLLLSIACAQSTRTHLL